MSVLTSVLSYAGAFLLVAGALLLIVAAWGVIVLPDALSRQHAATKAGTLSLAIICIGAMLLVGDPAWIWRLGLVLAFLLATLPVASHLLARAALREGIDPADVSAAPLIGGDETGDGAPGRAP